jgi:hypothetical protein
MTSRRNTDANAPVIAARGRPNERLSATPSEIVRTAPKAAACGAPNNEGAARGFLSKP